MANRILHILSPISSKKGRMVLSPLAAILGSKRKGGKVRKTGDYRLHRGERVLTKRQSKRYKRPRRFERA